MKPAIAPKRQILLVDDDPVYRRLLETAFEAEGMSVDVAESVSGLENKVMSTRFDAVVLDICLGEETGLESIPYVARHSPRTRVVVLTGHATVEWAVRALRKGATDFVTKDRSAREIVDVVRGVLDADSVGVTPNGVPATEYGLIGRSLPLMRVAHTIERLRNVDSTVVIHGESGTGKELVARALHKASRRSKEPFHAINCAAIPEQLLESELFGHVRGAFTDARSDRKGIFEICSEGTLLLDEIGEMPMALQAKLLRVLQEKEVTPVGASRTVRVNTRVLASTNRDLEEEVRKGRFREDLFFRLSVLRVEIPPLRDRREDIPLLVNHFLEHFNDRFNKFVALPDHEITARLMTYDWPGNVRELRNAVERGVVLADDGELHIEDVLPSLSAGRRDKSGDAPLMGAGEFALPLPEAKQHMEEAYLRRVLKISHGNISEASRLSGLYRANIYRLMARYGIDPADYKV